MKQSFREWSRDKIPESIKDHARTMRKEPTRAEEILWNRLRNRKLDNLKFRRQQHIEGFILDFYCQEFCLGVEVDGEYHQTAEQKIYDKLRSEYLEECGIRIIRFENQDVIDKTREVLKKIVEAVNERGAPSPQPLSQGRGVAEGRGEGALKYFTLKALLQREDWLSPAYVGIDKDGVIRYLSNLPNPEGSAIEAINGYAIPGFQNSHSHAFQYAMAGLAENHAPDKEDDFWSWREEMYKCALTVGPEEAEAIAAMLYAEMLRHGYTHVAEFHYLHHDKEGKEYANQAEMGERMVAAAQTAGIKITLVPVFYQKGGFGLDPQPRQRRFISKTTDDYLRLLEASRTAIQKYKNASLGFSVHSLRAVALQDVVRAYEYGPKDLPFHIHVAEQQKEVMDCLAFCGQRPMQWLLENLPTNERFHLVHSTHLDDNELKGVIASKANVVLCPSTEGNLGDGIFRMKEFYEHGGRWSIGTDSHIGLNPWEEFRMMDYRQRLITHRRNTFKGDAAKYLINEEVETGRKAMGQQATDHFGIGRPFDALVLDGASPLLQASSLQNLLPSIVYSGDVNNHLGTLVNGRWVIRNQRHKSQTSIRSRFVSALKQLNNR